MGRGIPVDVDHRSELAALGARVAEAISRGEFNAARELLEEAARALPQR